MTVSLAIFLFAAILMTAIGVSQIKSQTPVGFYSGEDIPEPGDLTDVRAWNKKHGAMWICYSIVLMLAWCVGYFLGGGVPGIIAMCAGMFIPLPLMALYHKRLKQAYYRK